MTVDKAKEIVKAQYPRAVCGLIEGEGYAIYSKRGGLSARISDPYIDFYYPGGAWKSAAARLADPAARGSKERER